jgi:hypothetical protein
MILQSRPGLRRWCQWCPPSRAHFLSKWWANHQSSRVFLWKECHKPIMTANGKHTTILTTYKNSDLGDGLWLFYPHYSIFHILCFSLFACQPLTCEGLAPWLKPPFWEGWFLFYVHVHAIIYSGMGWFIKSISQRCNGICPPNMKPRIANLKEHHRSCTSFFFKDSLSGLSVCKITNAHLW